MERTVRRHNPRYLHGDMPGFCDAQHVLSARRHQWGQRDGAVFFRVLRPDPVRALRIDRHGCSGDGLAVIVEDAYAHRLSYLRCSARAIRLEPQVDQLQPRRCLVAAANGDTDCFDPLSLRVVAQVAT